MTDAKTARAHLDEAIAFSREHSGGTRKQLFELFDILLVHDGTRHLPSSPSHRITLMEHFHRGEIDELVAFLERELENTDVPNRDI